MKTEKLLIYGLIAVIAYDYLKKAGYSFAQKFVAGTPKINFKLLTPTGIGARVIIPITNTTSINAPIDSLDLAIYYRNELITTGKMSGARTLPAGETVEIPIDVFINFTGLSASIIQLIRSRAIDNLIARGTISAGGITLPFEQIII